MRKGYLDWLRGVGVLVMIQAHVIDAWTLPTDRRSSVYMWIAFVDGLGAPIFLFLAGLAIVLGASARVRNGLTAREAAARARNRGWQIFALAFLFRLQSWAISRGPATGLLKVDVLNVMGVGLLIAAVLWGLGRTNARRAMLLAAAAVAATMLTPIVRTSGLVAWLPDPVEWYLRPRAGGQTFTLFPWAGFLLAGAALGVWLDAARSPRSERLANMAIGAAGIAMALGGYLASFLPPLYAQASFWTSSPTFFFVRLGLVTALVPFAYVWNLLPGRSPLQEFGRSSLFVYWIHVELVYGIATAALHRALPFGAAWIGFVLVSLAMFGLVKLKNRWGGSPRRLAWRTAASV